MTNKEYREKYPAGTKIRWLVRNCQITDAAKKDIGKIGRITGYDKFDNPFIFLPESEHFASNSTQLIPISWWAIWNDVKILSQKNQQLLFDFMR